MDHPIVMHLPSKIFCALTDHSGEGYYGPKTEAVLSSLVQHRIATTAAALQPWLDYADLDSEDGSEAAAPPAAPAPPTPTPGSDDATSARGYQWKQVFLPNSTELRVIHAGR